MMANRSEREDNTLLGQQEIRELSESESFNAPRPPVQSHAPMRGDEEMRDEEINDHPIEQVRLTVPSTDDPTLPCLTFRTWVLGIFSCCFLTFFNQFFGFRTTNITISSVVVSFLMFLIGRLMASTLPTRQYNVPFTRWSFTMNPGPFNTKEHVLISMFARCGTTGARAVAVLTANKAFYHKQMDALTAFMFVLTTQVLAYGWAGMLIKFLVDSPHAWWPSTLPQVSFFRTLHEDNDGGNGGNKRLDFFFRVFVFSCLLHLLPLYFFKFLSAMSIVCWFSKDSIMGQQIGSGLNGLGLGSFGLDWSTISNFLGSPLATPFPAAANAFVGFFLIVGVLTPISYWGFNAYSARKFPILSAQTFDNSGQSYDFKRIMDPKSMIINLKDYSRYSRLYLSISSAFVYGFRLSAITATISHVALFDGKTIWKLCREASDDLNVDVHTRVMKKNYESVPGWWYGIFLFVSLLLSFVVIGRLHTELQFPWWLIFVALLIPFVLTLPFGKIQSVTNMPMEFNVITNLIIGHANPGQPIANSVFKTYAIATSSRALGFLQEFKLCTYMKIPPKDMFLVQVVGQLLSSIVIFGTTRFLFNRIENICETELLPKGSPWTCPGDDVFFQSSIIWDVIGPQRMFLEEGVYKGWYWFFLAGLISIIIVGLLSRVFPNHKWIREINMPLIFSSYSLPVKPVNYISWAVVGYVFNHHVFTRHRDWWSKYNYVLSIALDASSALMGVLVSCAFAYMEHLGPLWWGSEAGDRCPLAHCPTDPSVKVPGCPVVS